MKHPASAQKRTVIMWCLFLLAANAIVFSQTLRFPFINLDDSDYVTSNPMVMAGLTWHGFVSSFSFHAANWHPLTWWSLMLDAQLFGTNPNGYHFTNLVLHTANAMALFLVLRQMTGAVHRAGAVALLFAIHPLRVESVAWVTERKDLLSGLFFILTIAAYTRWVRQKRGYWLLLICYALGLMAKPMIVTVPLLLLLVDYWPLGRDASLRRPISGADGSARRPCLDKIPLLVLAAAVCILTIMAQSRGLQTTQSFPLSTRVLNAVISYCIYVRQWFWPMDLAPFYPINQDFPTAISIVCIVLLTFFSVACVLLRRRLPAFFVGWWWYVLMLLPVIGLVQVGLQSHADRYTYLPEIGLAIALVWGGATLLARVPFAWKFTGLIAVAATLGIVAFGQAGYWKDSYILWNRAVSVNNSPTGYVGFGDALSARGDFDGAIVQFNKALALNPRHSPAESGLGIAYEKKSDIRAAMEHYERAIAIQSSSTIAQENLGSILVKQNRLAEGIAHLRAAVASKPDDDEAEFSLAAALMTAGDYAEADPHLQHAVEAQPSEPSRHLNLGICLLQTGHNAEAVAEFEKALKLQPNYAAAHYNLGTAAWQQGKTAEALREFRATLLLTPDDPDLLSSLAWILSTTADATLRNPREGLDFAQRADHIAGDKNPIVLRSLAAAQAGLGKFDDAERITTSAITLAGKLGQDGLRQELQRDLDSYRKRQVLRE